MTPLCLLFLQASPTKLISLRFPDLLIIAIYFVFVLGIGFYLKRFTKTGEDFFLAGREMTAWVAGLSFLVGQSGLARADGLGRPPRTSTASWPRTGTGSAPFRRCCSSAS